MTSISAIDTPTEPDCSSVETALTLLEREAPGAPLLALGQTIFWDEPMKAGVAIAVRKMGLDRKFVAGIHDTDYFAKLPSGPRQPGKFKALPHNDTTTRGLWSAAAEFSALFGSETVVTREILSKAGLQVERLVRARPGFLDGATEAWGWKGVVSLDEHAPITAEIPAAQVFDELFATLKWAFDLSMQSLGGANREAGQRFVDQMLARVCARRDEFPGASLAELYRALLKDMYEACADTTVDVEATTTSDLLRFNSQTASLPRFDLLNAFIAPESKVAAASAYDEAIHGSGLYGVSRFGAGAIPFDLVIPGQGRGTIRLGTRGAAIMTRTPRFLSYKKAPSSAVELAAAIEAKFGPNCVLVGKAVTLIGMLSREFVFVFHEGASNYVRHSRRLHQILAETGLRMKMNPILRVKYDAWSSLKVCCSWLNLPAPFQRAFGAEEVCAPSFSHRWIAVTNEQEHLLTELAALKRPIDLIRFLDRSLGGSWNELVGEYESLHDRLDTLQRELGDLRSERIGLYKLDRELRVARLEAEKEKGDHFRRAVFEKIPSERDMDERQRLTEQVEAVVARQNEVKALQRGLLQKQRALVADPEVQRIHERRRGIEIEAELKRLSLIRQAVIVSSGLRKANYRPSAWWFRLVCSDGLWFRETVSAAQAYLEPLE